MCRSDLQEVGDDADDLTGRLDRLLVTFAKTAADHVTRKAERLTLEWLAGGFLERGRGGRLHETEAAFAADHLEQAMNDALRDALLELSRGDALELTTAELLGARFAPWADGHLTALRGAGVPLAALQAAQRAIGEGETAAREAIIGHLEPVARASTSSSSGCDPRSPRSSPSVGVGREPPAARRPHGCGSPTSRDSSTSPSSSRERVSRASHPDAPAGPPVHGTSTPSEAEAGSSS